MLIRMALVLIYLVSPLALANEQEQAMALCHEIMAMHSKQHGNTDMSWLCQHNVNSVEVLRCAHDRMLEGESFAYASERCEMGK